MSIYVGLLTEEEYNDIRGQQYAPDSYFNPINCYYDDSIVKVISEEEMRDTVNERYLWVKDLPLIEYIPVPENFKPKA